MHKSLFEYLKVVPSPYAPSTAPFWDDEHISKHMLAAHLDEHTDAASRRPEFMDKSASWIAGLYGADGKRLLDLGCGPGLYAERFCKAGFEVTGVDLSARSIAYAQAHASVEELAIDYRRQNYFTLDERDIYDMATLIYCVFGEFSPADRRALLLKIFAALKPGGRFVLDVLSGDYLKHIKPGRKAGYCEEGFWADKPYIYVQTNIWYNDSWNILEQDVILTEQGCECYNIWNQVFTPDSLAKELESAGFDNIVFFDDVAGAPYTGESETLCAFAQKPL